MRALARPPHPEPKLLLGDWHPIVRDPLHLFSRLSWYHHAVHITMSCFFSVLLYLALSRLGVVPDPAREAKRGRWLAGMGLITLWIGVTTATLYDNYEWVVGGSFGALLLAAWAAAELPTRRLPRRSPRSRRGPGANSSSRPGVRPESRPAG